jgi:hypothetical protein
MAAPNVFVSYASDTRPLAEELTDALLNKGIKTWAGFKDLQPGQEWQLELDRAIENADLFLFLVDPQSRVTTWTDFEWRAILTKAWADSGKRVLPVVLGSAEPPPFLRKWVALNVDPVSEPRTWTNRVVNAVESVQSTSSPTLSARNRRERVKRLSEMARAVKALDRQSFGDTLTGPGQ